LAIEIASQLMSQEEKIDFIILFDGWAKYSEKLLSENYFKELMKKNMVNLNEKYRDTLLDLQYSREKLLFEYTIPKLDCDMILFKAQDVLPLFDEKNSYDNGLTKYFNKLQVHKLSGDHETILEQPNVSNAGIIFNNLLKKYCAGVQI